MTFYNIQDPDELFSGKFKFEELEKKKAEKLHTEYKKSSVEEYINSLNLSETIFVYQDDKGNVEVIPYNIIHTELEDLVYYSDNSHISDKFKKFVNTLKRLKIRKLDNRELFETSLNDRCYLIKNKEIHVWE